MAVNQFPEALLSSLRGRELVVFVGAGMSIPCGGFSWHALCAMFVDEMGAELGHEKIVSELRSFLDPSGHGSLSDAVERMALSTYDPLMLAQMFQDHVGRNRLIQILQKMCDAMSGPSSSHDLIASFGVKMFVTTNYDNLLEQALEKIGIASTVIVKEEDAAYWHLNSTRIIKMHGSLVNPFDANSVVIAREDYEAYAERRPTMDLLIRFLMKTGPVLLLGFSARDPNFLALHNRVRLAMKKHKNTVFFVSFDMPDPIQEYWRRYGFQPIVLPGVNKKLELDRWLLGLKAKL